MNDDTAWKPDPRRLYIPKSLSELNDQLTSMIGGAPTFKDASFPYQDITTEFHVLIEAFGIVRKKLGEEHYAALIDLAARSKALFEQDPEDDNGKTMEGIMLIWEMMDIVKSVRQRRVTNKLPDEEGEVTGD